MTGGRYDQRVHDRVVAQLGWLHDPMGPSGPHGLVGRRADVSWPVGCYVVTANDKRVRYVGKVCRRDLGYDARFGAHHQAVDSWGTVWLLPMKRHIPNHVVEAVEALLIAVFSPCDNAVRPRSPLVRRFHAA